MSKSNFFGPGANDVLNGTTIHLTSFLANPSLRATAYATADSKPWPERGSLTFNGDFSLPPNQGGKAGLSVPTVSWPALTRLRALLVQGLPVLEVVPWEELELERPQPASVRTKTRARDRRTRRHYHPNGHLKSGQGLLPRRRTDEGRPRRVLPRRRRLRAPAPARPSVPHGALPERRRRRLLPPEARAVAPGLRRRAVRPVSERPLDRLRDRGQQGGARVGDQSRVHRAAHLAFQRAEDRGARLSADRPRPVARRPVAVRARDRARRARRDGRTGARVVSQDVGRHRPARHGADQAGA